LLGCIVRCFRSLAHECEWTKWGRSFFPMGKCCPVCRNWKENKNRRCLGLSLRAGTEFSLLPWSSKIQAHWPLYFRIYTSDSFILLLHEYDLFAHQLLYLYGYCAYACKNMYANIGLWRALLCFYVFQRSFLLKKCK
jgi:hypothetical protein